MAATAQSERSNNIQFIHFLFLVFLRIILPLNDTRFRFYSNHKFKSFRIPTVIDEFLRKYH